ncbi:MAG: glycosyltransferase family 4 protein [Chlamydiales bacterium]|nr:glycosyltransferase family 4 protein [Chlamydiales bacterium]
MKNVGLVTDIAFWEAGTGQNARISALHDFLQNHCKLTLYYLEEEGSLDALKRVEHDFIIVEKLHLDWIVDLGLKSPLYLDVHDLISERAASFQQFNRACSAITFEEEIERMRRFDKLIFMQKEELEKIAVHIERDRLLYCPHPVVPEVEPLIREEVESISFFGGPSWPNVDSIQWFHDAVLPLLGPLSQKCLIQGAFLCSPFSAFLPHLSKGRLFPSLASYYPTIDIAINPMLYGGGGLKIKTVEAIAHGVPLVTTSVGADGLLQEAGRSFLVANTAVEFAEAIQRLASSPTLRRELSSRARAYASEHFTPFACFNRLLSPF